MFTTSDPDEGEAFAAARRAAFPALERLGSLLLEDVGVALPALPALVRGIEKIAETQRGRRSRWSPMPATATPIRWSSTTPPTPDETKRAYAAFGEVMDLALEFGGTITGEHGVGRLKKDWLPAYLGEDVMALTRTIKDALDPQGILNPGAVLSPHVRSGRLTVALLVVTGVLAVVDWVAVARSITASSTSRSR